MKRNHSFFAAMLVLNLLSGYNQKSSAATSVQVSFTSDCLDGGKTYKLTVPANYSGLLPSMMPLAEVKFQTTKTLHI